jgi:hypothetical protein
MNSLNAENEILANGDVAGVADAVGNAIKAIRMQRACKRKSIESKQ